MSMYPPYNSKIIPNERIARINDDGGDVVSSSKNRVFILCDISRAEKTNGILKKIIRIPLMSMYIHG